MADVIEFAPVEVATARPVRKVEIKLTNNVTNNIHRPTMGGQFELKQNMVQLFHTSG